MISRFKTDYSYITTIEVQVLHIIALITPHPGYIRTRSERFRSTDFFPNYFELFRTICVLCLAYLRTVPNGLEVAYVIETPLLGWDRFRLDWFKPGCFCGLSTDHCILQACSITHVMCTLSIVCFAIKKQKLSVVKENWKYSKPKVTHRKFKKTKGELHKVSPQWHDFFANSDKFFGQVSLSESWKLWPGCINPWLTIWTLDCKTPSLYRKLTRDRTPEPARKPLVNHS